MTGACLTGGGVPTRCGGVAGFAGVRGSALRRLPASVGWPGGGRPGETTGPGRFSGLLPAVDGPVYAVSCGAGPTWLTIMDFRQA
jgi:hypothetical protein